MHTSACGAPASLLSGAAPPPPEAIDRQHVQNAIAARHLKGLLGTSAQGIYKWRHFLSTQLKTVPRAPVLFASIVTVSQIVVSGLNGWDFSKI